MVLSDKWHIKAGFRRLPAHGATEPLLNGHDSLLRVSNTRVKNHIFRVLPFLRRLIYSITYIESAPISNLNPSAALVLKQRLNSA
jgi:hypothetical protein